MQTIQVITLDLDDTLWEIHPVIHRAERRLYEWMGEEYPRIVDQYSREALAGFRREVVKEFPHLSHDYTFLRRTVLGRAAESSGYSGDFVDQAMDVFDQERNAVDIFPEVIPTLEALSRDYTLVAVTNGNARLDMIGIDHLFHHMVSARDAGAAKPAPAIFTKAMEVSGGTPATTLHVGDDPHMDVVGAQGAGLRAVWVNRNNSDWPDEHAVLPDLEVRHIGEIPAWLERWHSG